MRLGRGLADRRRRHRVVAVVAWPDLAKLVFGTYKPELVLPKLDVRVVSLGKLLDALPQYIISCRIVNPAILLDERERLLDALVGVHMMTTLFAKSRHQLFRRPKDLLAALALLWRSWDFCRGYRQGKGDLVRASAQHYGDL